MDYNGELASKCGSSFKNIDAYLQAIVFWCAPITHGGEALTKEQVQAKIDANPAAAQVLLSASKDTLAFHKAQDPELVAEMVPDRYFLDGAYEWLPNSLTLDELRPEFDIQPDE